MEKSTSEVSDPTEAEVVVAPPNLTGYDLANDDIPTILSQWFQKNMRTRWLELLTEFGATNLFFISGDSLVLEFLREAHVRWATGNSIPHMLHLSWAIEQFLRQMIDAGCVFRVVFFRALRPAYHDLSLNESSDKHGTGALLARDAIVNHLKRVNVPGLEIDDSLDNWWDATWLSYLEVESPGFMLVSPMWRTTGTISILLRTLILQLFSQRVSLAFLAELKFSDNRIYTFCWEPYDRRAEIELFKAVGSKLPAFVAALPAPKSRADAQKGVTAAFNSQSRDWRYALTVEACKHMLASSKDAVLVDLAKVTVVHSVLLKHLSLQERAWRLPEAAQSATSALTKFYCAFSQELTVCLEAAADLVQEDESSSVTLVDLFDWRVFSVLLHCLLSSKSQDLAQMKLTPAIADEIPKLWGAVSSAPLFPLFSSDSLKALHGSGLFDFSTLKPLEPLDSASEPLPIRSPITDAILGDLKPRLPRNRDYELQKSLAAGSKKFFDEWHWHSGRKITLEESSLSDDGAGAYGSSARNTQSYLNFVERFAQSLLMKPSWKPRVRTANPDPDIKKKVQAEIDDENASPAAAKSNNQAARRSKEAADELQKLNNLDKDAEGTPLPEKRRMLESFKGNSRTATVEADFKVIDVMVEQFQSERDRTFSSLSEEAKQNRQLIYATDIMRLIFDLVEVYQDTTLMTPARKKRIVEVSMLLGLFDLAEALAAKLQAPSSMVAQLVRTTAMKVSLSSSRFQLKCMGPFMERDTASLKDPRVPFLADDWQVKVLDAIDKRNSLLVVAPTSAGKTFISFYAMERVLKDDQYPDGVVVYVAPTKALVNQVAAEVYAQFAKAPWLKAQPGIQTYGAFTRDYRFFPTKCRVLVTVPQCLEILLLSPTHFATWRKKLRYVIFDEIHSINQEDGSIWERLVSMVPCPAIALSATIGESQIFAKWLSSVASRTGHQFQHVVHPHRFSDLQKNLLIINPKESAKKNQSQLELDIEYLHPWATFTLRQFARDIPPDVALSPRDCLELYMAMEKAVLQLHDHAESLSGEDEKAFVGLNPDKYFSDLLVISQRRCRQYENELKALFTIWIRGHKRALVETTLAHLSKVPLSRYREMADSFASSNEDIYSKKFITKVIPETLLMLKKKNMLPAICFNFERKYCEDLAITVGKFLEDKEKDWRQSPEYLDQVRRYNKSLEMAKQNEKQQAKQKRQNVEQQMADAEMMDQGVNPADMMHPDCSFTTIGEVMSRSELDDDKASIGDSVHPILVRALRRGVGVHHAGLHKRYLQTVERYFRAGQLKVVFATGTLALGINMPCRTTLFLGDSNFLTPLQYRQMSGRAGRRGFDPIGNVLFMGIGPQKIRKLEASSLPILRGHFPFTTSYLLRTLVLGSGAAASSNVADIKSLYAAAVVEAPPTPAAPEPEPDVVDDWEALDDDETPSEAAPEPTPQAVAEPEVQEKPIVLPKDLQAISHIVSEFFRDPLFCLQRNYLQEQVQNHVRFSLEFLVRAGLINLHGEPINLAGIVTHLSYTEPANFVICELLVSNAIHSLCAKAESDWASVSRSLIHILSSLFCRLGVPQALKMEYERLKDTNELKPHQIVLPALPADVQSVFDQHEDTVRRVYVSSVMEFVHTNLARLGTDNVLPLSTLQMPEKSLGLFDAFVASCAGNSFDKTKITVAARSPFVALSGWDDHFTSTTDLSSTVRAGIYLPPEAMPSLDITDLSGAKMPLNAYVLDMWNWTNREWLEQRNHIREADCFAYFKEFMLTLKAISVALQRRVVPLGAALLGQELSDPVANAFRRLADDFEDKFAKLFGTRVVRRYIMRVYGFRGDLRDFRKLPIDKEIAKKTRITIRDWRFGMDEQRRIILKIETRSAQDLKDLTDKQHQWLLDGWKILEVRKETKDHN
jgi:ATP-dependent RNA helicase DDX60